MSSLTTDFLVGIKSQWTLRCTDESACQCQVLVAPTLAWHGVIAYRAMHAASAHRQTRAPDIYKLIMTCRQCNSLINGIDVCFPCDTHRKWERHDICLECAHMRIQRFDQVMVALHEVFESPTHPLREQRALFRDCLCVIAHFVAGIIVKHQS